MAGIFGLMGGGDAGAKYRANASGLVNSLAPVRNTYYGLADKAKDMYSGFSPQYQTAVQSLGDTLRQRVGQQGTARIAARNLAGVAPAYDNAASRVAAGGVVASGGGAPTSDAYTAGEQAQIALGRAGATAGAVNAAGDTIDARNIGAGEGLVNLYGGAQGNALAQALQGYGAGAQVTGQEIQGNLGIGAQETAIEQARQQQIMQLLGGAGQVAGGLIGRSFLPRRPGNPIQSLQYG